ncbi:MAG: NAD-dependent epimerase/dehydratase family protein [Solirubrobacteraceae bacterium]
MADCLIIGGGFIGSHVARLLAKEGHSVTVYSRSFGDLIADMESPKIRKVRGEIPPAEALAELIAATDLVLYLAGGSTPAGSLTDPGGSVALSVVPATAVLDLMCTTSTRRIVLASSGGQVYGEPHYRPTPESHPTEPITIHGHNALTIERYAAFYARRNGLEPVILRYSNPYGPGQQARRGQGVVAAWAVALAREKPLVLYGEPAQVRRDFVYASDAAEATVLAGFDASPGIYNVGAGRSHSLEEVLGVLTTVSGRQAQIIQEPMRSVDLSVTELDCSRIHAETGWQASTELRSGLGATWAHALSQAHQDHTPSARMVG